MIEQLLTGGVKSPNGSGVGVKNVHERIQLYYGKGYGLSFQSELEEGTTVTITIPAIKSGQENQDEGRVIND
ncbi:hypothetical protein D3C76_1659430 [compost metagenome]